MKIVFVQKNGSYLSHMVVNRLDEIFLPIYVLFNDMVLHFDVADEDFDFL